MKHIKKIIAVAAAAACTLAMGSMLIACNGGTEYTFEAENAATEGEGLQMGNTPGPATVTESGVLWSEDGTGTDPVGGYENFNGVGQKIIWTVNADADGKGTITLYAASNAMAFLESRMSLVELDFESVSAYKLTCNDQEISLKGKLPATPMNESSFAQPGTWWHVGTVSGDINLKAGENKIVLEIVGSVDGTMSSGINVDKIVIKSSTALSEKAA